MKHILPFLLILLSSNLYAGKKTYTYDVTVSSLGEQKPLEGIMVRCVREDGSSFEALTNKEGKVSFSKLRDKYLDVEIIDPLGNYREASASVFNKKREDQSDNVKMRYNYSKEAALIKSKSNFEDPKDSSNVYFQTIEKIEECDKFIDAEFPGGFQAVIKFVAENMIYPREMADNDIQGRLYLGFIIEADGAVSNIRIEKSAIPAANQEAILVVCYFPNWIPATCDGVPVRSMYKLPITLALE